MGSGKSSVGKKLADVLGFHYFDLDDFIQEKEGKSIKEIFSIKGEVYFRKIESKYLSEIISSSNSVISLGGGTPCYGNNMQTIKNSEITSSIYLKASLTNLTDRLFLEKNNRPLIAHIEDKGELQEFIGKHLFERSMYYNQSDITINTDRISVDEVVETIVLKLF